MTIMTPATIRIPVLRPPLDCVRGSLGCPCPEHLVNSSGRERTNAACAFPADDPQTYSITARGSIVRAYPCDSIIQYVQDF